MVEILVLKKRKDFIRVASGSKMVAPSLILQAARSLSIEPVEAKIGYTVTKKIGHAHLRNKTKRRLRAAAYEIFPKLALPNFEYVMIGRYNTASIDFLLLKKDMETAFVRLNKLLKNEDKNEKTPHLAD